MGVVAVIVSHDPELDRFELVLDRVSGQVGRVIIVNNGSRSEGVLRGYAVVLVIATSLRLASTLGVTYALRVGINYAIKYGPDWLLLLDDDTVLKMNCESCEYDIILNDYEHVRLFKELIFEYHSYATNRSVTELINTMGREFNCQL